MRFLISCLLVLLFTNQASASQSLNKNMDLCRAATQAAERQFNIPRNLLRAISLTESGRWVENDKANIAWPWTVASGAAGQFFPTKTDAIRHVKELQAQGIVNIDVGCMQINLRYHPDAFANLNDAFDPYKNTRYAGDFLSRLFNESKSWHAAAGNYHSKEPGKNMYYREKVLGFWNVANQESNPAASEIAVPKDNKQFYKVAKLDNNRMESLNNSFRERINAHNQAMSRAEKMAAQVSDWRNSRSLSNYGSANAARQKALYNQKRKKALLLPTTSERSLTAGQFSQRRSAQLDRWRKTTANPSLFQNSNTTRPSTLLGQ